MDFIQTINEAIKQAMLAKDSRKLGALRAIKAEILKEQTKEGGTGELTEEAGTKILTKLVKQRRDAAEIYKGQNRKDLEEEELYQASVIEEYLPQQMTEEQITEYLKNLLKQTGISTAKDMGKIMGMASKELAGKADNKKISTILKELLS